MAENTHDGSVDQMRVVQYMAGVLGEFAASGLINIVGGCCGTTPEHITAIRTAALEHSSVVGSI